MNLKNPTVGNIYTLPDGRQLYYLGTRTQPGERTKCRIAWHHDDPAAMEVVTMSPMELRKLISLEDVTISVIPTDHPIRGEFGKRGRKPAFTKITEVVLKDTKIPEIPDNPPSVSNEDNPTSAASIEPQPPAPPAPAISPAAPAPPLPPKKKKDGFFKELSDGLLWWLGASPKSDAPKG